MNKSFASNNTQEKIKFSRENFLRAWSCCDAEYFLPRIRPRGCPGLWYPLGGSIGRLGCSFAWSKTVGCMSRSLDVTRWKFNEEQWYQRLFFLCSDLPRVEWMIASCYKRVFIRRSPKRMRASNCVLWVDHRSNWVMVYKTPRFRANNFQY